MDIFEFVKNQKNNEERAKDNTRFIDWRKI